MAKYVIFADPERTQIGMTEADSPTLDRARVDVTTEESAAEERLLPILLEFEAADWDAAKERMERWIEEERSRDYAR